MGAVGRKGGAPLFCESPAFCVIRGPFVMPRGTGASLERLRAPLDDDGLSQGPQVRDASRTCSHLHHAPAFHSALRAYMPACAHTLLVHRRTTAKCKRPHSLFLSFCISFCSLVPHSFHGAITFRHVRFRVPRETVSRRTTVMKPGSCLWCTYSLKHGPKCPLGSPSPLHNERLIFLRATSPTTDSHAAAASRHAGFC